MAELFQTSSLYDVVHPAPVSLKDLSAIAVSIKIWRCEVIKCRSRLKTFNPASRKISLKTLLPDLPTQVFELIDKYVKKFGPSMENWLQSHYKSVFAYHRNHKNDILKVFDDFVADYDGTIDYVRTAERMMICKRLRKVEKFIVACTYCFKECITRIWRSSLTGLTNISFTKSPQLFYWVSYLVKKLDRISTPRRNMYKIMFDRYMACNRPSMEYFWYKIPLQRQLRRALKLYKRDVGSFVRFILPKLDDRQLDEFVNNKGCELILDLWKKHFCCEKFILPTWRYIGNKMNVDTLTNLVVGILKLEAMAFEENLNEEPDNWLYFCSEFWNGIRPNLKQSIVANILSHSRLLEDMRSAIGGHRSDRRFVGFLLICLSSATFEQRNTFWQNCWSHLIAGTRNEDLLQIMNLCFENQHEITQFKVNIMAESAAVRYRCIVLLLDARLDELNDLIDFCFPQIQEARNFKQLLLWASLLVDDNCLSSQLASQVEKFDLFMKGAFNNADQFAAFEKELMAIPAVRDYLSGRNICPTSISYEQLLKLIRENVSD